MRFQAKNDVSFCWLRSEERHMGLFPHAFAENPGGNLAFFAPDYALSTATPWILGDEVDVVLEKEALPKLVHRAEPSSADFARVFESIQTLINEEYFEKVVPVVIERLEFSGALRPQMFADAILEPRRYQFNYGYSFADEGMVGITPELLFEVHGEKLTTMALAGTGKADGPSLLEIAKERFEHQLVIDHIVRELKVFGEPEVGRTEERVYGVLKHLYTPIELRLKRLPSFMELVVALHPTAALGGWPRRPAIEWLEAQTFHTTRKRFGAPFGYMRGEEMACVVAIRGMQWVPQKAQLLSGCGVVAQSEALSEWNELALKRQAIALLLGLKL